MPTDKKRAPRKKKLKLTNEQLTKIALRCMELARGMRVAGKPARTADFKSVIKDEVSKL